MTLDSVTLAILLGVCNLLVVPFVGYVFRSGKAIETKQVADNAARVAEHAAMRYDMLKLQMDMHTQNQERYATRADLTELKQLVVHVLDIVKPMAAQMQVPAALGPL